MSTFWPEVFYRDSDIRGVLLQIEFSEYVCKTETIKLFTFFKMLRIEVNDYWQMYQLYDWRKELLVESFKFGNPGQIKISQIKNSIFTYY